MLLRQHMSFLVDNLFAYLQVDVLESQWTHLVESIQRSQDFEEVRLLHDSYLMQITDQCFLNQSQVMKALQDVLHMCRLLCRLLKQMDDETVRSQKFQEEFMRIKGQFEKQSNIVFKLLSTFKNYHAHQSSPYLSQLLLRLDYNNFLTNLSEKIEQEKNEQILSKHQQMRF